MEAGFAIQISTRNEGEIDGDFIHHTGDDFDSHFTSPHCLFFLQGSDMSGEKMLRGMDTCATSEGLL